MIQKGWIGLTVKGKKNRYCQWRGRWDLEGWVGMRIRGICKAGMRMDGESTVKDTGIWRHLWDKLETQSNHNSLPGTFEGDPS